MSRQDSKREWNEWAWKQRPGPLNQRPNPTLVRARLAAKQGAVRTNPINLPWVRNVLPVAFAYSLPWCFASPDPPWFRELVERLRKMPLERLSKIVEAMGDDDE